MGRSPATDAEALVRAAAIVFEDKGYRNASIDDVAVAAGVSRPTVYKYLKNKQELLDRMVDVVTGDIGDRLREASDADVSAEARLRTVVGIHIESATALRNFYSSLFSEQTELSAAGRRRFSMWARGIALQFQDLLDDYSAERRGDVKPDTWITSNLILTMLTTLYRWYDPAGQTSPAELTDQIVAMVGGVVPCGVKEGQELDD
jgi:AcrR family transcriptional regulator